MPQIAIGKKHFRDSKHHRKTTVDDLHMSGLETFPKQGNYKRTQIAEARTGTNKSKICFQIQKKEFRLLLNLHHLVGIIGMNFA